MYLCHINHVIYGHFRPFLGRNALDTPCLKQVMLFVNVTSFVDTVTSYMTSQHHMFIGHMTIYYERAANTSEGRVSVSLLGLTLSSETLLWLVSNTCRSRCIKCISRQEPNCFNSNHCVLALLNSAASPAGTHKYLNKTRECCSTPC